MRCLCCDISVEEATLEVQEHDEQDGNSIYPSDVADKLNLDYDLVRDICSRLVAEGILETAHVKSRK